MKRSAIELWGGVECTLNRVRDTYFDQMARSGHDTRHGDLDRFAALGLRVLRYPLLWERLCPVSLDSPQWSWADQRMRQLRRLGITPIVGLLHHGSGPRYTSLTDPGFPEGLARFAGLVAERFPWVRHYTPVNEPLTTARFSGLYGLWYPHGRSNATFARALWNQCRGTALAMERIRRVRPDALLVQTEDLGTVHSTAPLRYQARFENHRKWLTWDLLAGRVRKGHPLWKFLRSSGLSEKELGLLSESPCPADIVGINHYVTSSRFLDHRLEKYPPWLHGGNGEDAYADIEAVRAERLRTRPLGALLEEAWDRYRTPLAITEAHLACTREEQLRWLAEVWREAGRARAKVAAVTVWALLGSFDWDSLVTLPRGHYESGPFEVRSREPRRTALAQMAQALAQGKPYNHPVLAGKGWWQRKTAARGRTRPILITGAGTLGHAFARLCQARSLTYRLVGRGDLDITDEAAVRSAIEGLRPWAVVNAAGYVRVDEAEDEPERCFRENLLGPSVLARQCARTKTSLLTFSSEIVFDGKTQVPYRESFAPCPLNVYGRSKAEAEAAVVGAHPGALVIRTSAFFGPWDAHNFVTLALSRLRGGLPFEAADDTVVSPTYVPDLGNASLNLLIDGESGLWHLANQGAVTWAELARRAARYASLDAALVEGRPLGHFPFKAPRPSFSALGSERGLLLADLDSALDRYSRAREVA